MSSKVHALSHASKPAMSRPGFGWVVGGWMIASLGLWASLTAYGLKHPDGRRPASPSAWPPDVSPPLGSDRPTVCLFLHPRCPCSRASVSELGRVLSDVESAPRIYVFVTRPRHTVDVPAWTDTATVRRVERWGGVEVVDDIGGRLASRFGAVTSGTVHVYGRDGVRRFNGGVTASRGHEGGNPGADRIREILSSPECSAFSAGPVSWHPVFGCRLCLPGVTPS